jgi:hypothetical protein
MKKILFLVLTLMTNITLASNGFYVINKCDSQSFLNALNTRGFKTLDIDANKTYAKIDHVNAKGQVTWGPSITAHNALLVKTNGNANKTAFLTFVGNVKKYIESDSCLKYAGFDAVIQDQAADLSWGVDLKALGHSVDHANLTAALLKNDDKRPIVLLPDTNIFINQLVPDSLYSVDVVASGDPACKVLMEETKNMATSTHATILANGMTLTSNNVAVRNIVTHCKGNFTKPDILNASLQKAILFCKQGENCVLNKSNDSYYGNSLETSQILYSAYNRGIPVIQSIFNDYRITTDYDYEKHVIRVGSYLEDAQLVYGTVGNSGPDIVVPTTQTGLTPAWFNPVKNKMVYTKQLNIGNSLSTALVSSIVATMMDQCRLASNGDKKLTPDEVKDILNRTAKKIPILPERIANKALAAKNIFKNSRNKYVRGGIIQPTQAILETQGFCKSTKPVEPIGHCVPSKTDISLSECIAFEEDWLKRLGITTANVRIFDGGPQPPWASHYWWYIYDAPLAHVFGKSDGLWWTE